MRLPRQYELVLLVTPEADAARQAEVFEGVRKFVVEHGGSVTSEDDWGKRKLAYKIGRHGEAVYRAMQMDMEAPAAKALEANLVLNEAVIRSLLSRKEELKGAIGRARAKAKAKAAAKAAAMATATVTATAEPPATAPTGV